MKHLTAWHVHGNVMIFFDIARWPNIIIYLKENWHSYIWHFWYSDDDPVSSFLLISWFLFKHGPKLQALCICVHTHSHCACYDPILMVATCLVASLRQTNRDLSPGKWPLMKIVIKEQHLFCTHNEANSFMWPTASTVSPNRVVCLVHLHQTAQQTGARREHACFPYGSVCSVVLDL